MDHSWIGSIKTTDRLGLAIAGALILLATGPLASASAAGPELTITSPAGGSTTKSHAVSFSGTTNDSTDLVKLTISRSHGSTVTAEVAPAGGTWAIESVELPEDDTYTAVAEQVNLLAETGASAPVTFSVDTVAPAVSITSPGENEHVKTPSGTYSGSAGHAPGDSTSLDLLIYEGSSPFGTPEKITIERSGGSWSESEGPPLPDGTYTAEIVQEDAAGNIGAAMHTFTIETNTPRVTLNPLAAFTTNTTPSFSGNVDTTKGVVESVTVTIFRGATAAESAEQAEEPITVPASGPTWTTGPTAQLPDGTYTAQAEQKNLAGTPGFSAPSTFTVDTIAPAVSLIAPPASAGLETVSGTAGTAAGDLSAITIELFSGSTSQGQAPIETLIVNASEGAWSATLAGLAGGSYAVRAEQSDQVGNRGVSADSAFTVTALVGTGLMPPLASFTWVPASPTVGQSVSLISNSLAGSSAITAFAWDTAGSGPFAAVGPIVTTTFSTVGPHAVRLRVADANGLSSVVAKTINVTAAALKLMQPFPIVRIAGVETGNGVKVRLLTVQAPLSTKVVVTCKGHGCKTKSESRVATASSKNKTKAGAVTLAFQRFERPLRVGVVLQIRVSKEGEIGKYTSFTIRKHKLPLRFDACLQPTSSKPIACPTP
jgi:Bacterial Ig-like domain/PKD domain